MQTIQEIQEAIAKQAKEKNWGTTPEEINLGEKIALLHSEVSEALDAYKKKDTEGFKEELVDVIMRTLHLCSIFDVDVLPLVEKKLEKNKERDWSDFNL